MEIKGQKSRSIYTKIVVIVCSFLSSLFLIHSTTMALSWNPKCVLLNYLKSNYPWEKIELSDFSINGRLPDPPVNINIEKGPPGKTVFRMEFRNGEFVSGTTNIRVFEDVVFSKRSLKKGHCLQREDLYEKTIEIVRIQTGAVNNIDNVIGKTLTRSIIANVPIMDYMLASTPMLKKGRKVNLVIESPSFIITTLGELKENAYVGETVKVVNTESKKIINGLLVDESTVRVSF